MKILLFSLSIIAFSFNLYGKTKVAKITSTIAVIYKDNLLKRPMGFIRKGKKIRVGTLNQATSHILPVIIEGKIGYIQKKDISSIKEKLVIKEHNLDYSLLSKVDQGLKNQSASFFYGIGPSANEWNELSEFIEDDKTSSMKCLSFELIHKINTAKLSIAVGLEKLGFNQESAELKMLLGKIGLYYNFLERNFFNIQGNISVLLSGDAQLSSSYSEEPSRGLAYGLRGSILTRFYPEANYGLILGIFSQKIQFSNLEAIKNFDEDEYELKTLSGTGLYAGLSFNF